MWDPLIWDPHLWDLRIWDPRMGDSRIWDQHMWDPRMWDPRIWDPSMWDPCIWDPRMWDPCIPVFEILVNHYTQTCVKFLRIQSFLWRYINTRSSMTNRPLEATIKCHNIVKMSRLSMHFTLINLMRNILTPHQIYSVAHKYIHPNLL